MLVCPSPQGTRQAIVNTTRTNRFRSQAPRSLNRVRKYFAKAGTSPGGQESFRQPVIPPAPLTGDVGRDRGDAGCALLFSAGIWQVFGSAPPSAPPIFLAKGTAALASQFPKPLNSLASTIRRGSRGAKIRS